MCQPNDSIRAVSVGVSYGLLLPGPVPRLDDESPRDWQHPRIEPAESVRAVGEHIRQVLQLPPLEQR